MFARNASWGPPRPGKLPSLPRLPGTRDEDEGEPSLTFPQRVVLALAEGLASGAAPVLVNYLLHKLDPNVFGAEEESDEDE